MAKKKKGLTAKQRKMLIRIIVGIVLLAADIIITHIVKLPRPAELAMFLLPFAAAGYDVVIKAVKHILSGQMLDENLLMTIATIGAFAVGEYSEGAAVMLFYQVGELFQSIATTRSRRSISELMDIRPDIAAVIRDGERCEVDPAEVEIGEIIEVRAGEKLPLDGVIISGETTLDTAALTGESLPREAGEGSEVLSGCVNLTGVIRVRTTKGFGDSTASKILKLVEESSAKKAKSENFITRFARVYTPVVVGAAVVLAFLPPLVSSIKLVDSVTRALNFLVVSCPCALVISVPMSFFGGIGGASRQGVLIKGGSYLETLAGTDTVIFDKTGTLTRGRPEVQNVNAPDEERTLSLAAAAEVFSNHPIARSIVACAKQRGISVPEAQEHTELAGRGISCILEGKELLAGNLRLMEEKGISGVTEDNSGTMVHIACDGEYSGCIRLGDSLKSGSREVISALSDMGIATVILTGDSKAAGEAAAAELGVTEVHTELLPADKVRLAEEIITREGKHTTAFVGDGINDAPVLSRADVGIAMGALGSDAAIEAADIVLMDDDPRGIITAIGISRRTLRIVRENIVFAIGVKLLVLVTSAIGVTNMWAAVFADVGVAVIAILNAMRALKKIEK